MERRRVLRRKDQIASLKHALPFVVEARDGLKILGFHCFPESWREVFIGLWQGHARAAAEFDRGIVS